MDVIYINRTEPFGSINIYNIHPGVLSRERGEILSYMGELMVVQAPLAHKESERDTSSENGGFHARWCSPFMSVS
jgi:hypothetical protein